MVAAGEDDITGRIIDAGDEGVGLVRFDERAGFIETFRGERFDRDEVRISEVREGVTFG